MGGDGRDSDDDDEADRGEWHGTPSAADEPTAAVVDCDTMDEEDVYLPPLLLLRPLSSPSLLVVAIVNVLSAGAISLNVYVVPPCPLTLSVST